MAGIPENVEGAAAKRMARSTASGGPIRAISALLAGGIASKKKKTTEFGGRDSAIDFYNRDLYQSRRAAEALELAKTKGKQERKTVKSKGKQERKSSTHSAKTTTDLMKTLSEYAPVSEIKHDKTSAKFDIKKGEGLPAVESSKHAEGPQWRFPYQDRTPEAKDITSALKGGHIDSDIAAELSDATAKPTTTRNSSTGKMETHPEYAAFVKADAAAAKAGRPASGRVSGRYSTPSGYEAVDAYNATKKNS